MSTLSVHSVPPDRIQSELNKIWESLETTNVTRASLFNLIIFIEKNHRLPYIKKIVQNVVQKFPSRVLFVSVDSQTKEDFLKTEVSILSASKEVDIACDYIQIEAGGSCLQRVPFVVLPHILPDLPVYLLWAEDPCKSDTLLDKLGQFAGRLIFDSETTDHLPRFAASVLQRHERLACDVADLNWARIESWRDILSTIFYSEEKLEKIRQAKTIHIAFNAQETQFFCHTKIQALYLQAWLAGQLQWNFQTLKMDDHSCRLTYRSPLGDLEIVLEGVTHANLPPGMVLSVEIHTKDNEEFRFDRNLQRIHEIIYQHSTPSQCDIPSYYLFSKAEAGQSLVKEIGHRGTSEHYLKVLNLIKEMDKFGLC